MIGDSHTSLFSDEQRSSTIQAIHVTIEGIDGSGKSSMASALHQLLQKQGILCQIISWSTATQYQIIAEPFNDLGVMTPEVLAAIQASTSLSLLQKTVEQPYTVFLWDRYVYSSYANCIVRGVPRALMLRIVDMFPTPACNIFLRTEPEICYRRIMNRGGVSFFESGMDRIFPGPRRALGMRRYEENDFSASLIKALFLETMTEWNQHLDAVIPKDMRLEFNNWDFTTLEEDMQRIINRLTPYLSI